MSIFDHSRRALPWLALICILIVHATAVIRIKPAVFFGLSEDDGIYFSSAKALAEGQGYVLSSVPGTPAATKYPILYPWLLSWVWRWNPSFPSNLNDGAVLNIVFGSAFIIGAFVFFKEIGRLGDAESLFLSAFCGVQPLILVYTANLLPEIPFAALTLWALVMAMRVTKSGANSMSAVLCGLLAGVSILMRVLGVPVAAGIYLAILYRKGWRRSLVFACSVAPFLTVLIWRSIISAPANAPQSASFQCSRVWQMSWMYYTNYLSFWKAAAIQSHAIWNMIRANLTILSLQPGMYFVDPQLLRPSKLTMVAAFLLSIAVWKGLIFHARRRVEPIHFVLAIYLIPVILWDYPDVERFLVPFLPFIVLGLWLEIRRVLLLVKRALENKDPGEKPAALFLCFVAFAVALLIGLSFKVGITSMIEQSKLRGKMMDEKRSAYTWLRKNTSDSAKVIAYEDASLFLYASRQSFRPVIFSPAGDFQPEQLRTELECITASAQELGASYWLISDDDFGMEAGEISRPARAREKDFENALPRAFRSDGGHVRIYRMKPAVNPSR